VAPIVTAGSDQNIIFGQMALVSATFTDALGDTHTATIDWGDGSTDTIDPATSPLAIPDHEYDNVGDYTVTITVDDGTDSSFDTLTVSVGLVVIGDSPILNPIDNSKVQQGRNLPVNAQFFDAFGDPISTLTVTVWLDDLSDGEGNEFAATSTKKNVQDNIVKWKQSTQQYEYSLSTDTLNASPEGLDHKFIIKVMDNSGNPYLTFSQTMSIIN
jgi:hypothetical protein